MLAFISYIENGTKSQRKRLAKQEPKKVFYNSGLNVVESREDCSNADFIILNELEDDNFLYVGVLTHEAAVFCDSFYCGGVGAKWCIGTKNNQDYFYDYVEDSLFVLAFNKSSNAEQRKFMFQFQLGKAPQIWDQMDEVYKEDELEGELLRDGKEILNVFMNNIAQYTTVYSNLVESTGSAEEFMTIILSPSGRDPIPYRNIKNDVFSKDVLLEHYRRNRILLINFEDEEVENIFGSKNNSLSEIYSIIADKLGLDIKDEDLNITFTNLKTKQLIYDCTSFLGSLDIRDTHIDEFIYEKPYDVNKLFLFFLPTTIDKVILAKDNPDINSYSSMIGLLGAGLIGEVVTG